MRSVSSADVRPSSVLAGMSPWKFHTLQNRRCNRAVADWLLMDGHHVSVVEGEGFVHMIKLLEPRFEPPSRSYHQTV